MKRSVRSRKSSQCGGRHQCFRARGLCDSLIWCCDGRRRCHASGQMSVVQRKRERQVLNHWTPTVLRVWRKEMSIETSSHGNRMSWWVRSVSMMRLRPGKNHPRHRTNNYYTLRKVQKILPYALRSENTYSLNVYGGSCHSLIFMRDE